MSFSVKPSFARGSGLILAGLLLAPVLWGQAAGVEKRPDLVVSEWKVAAMPRFEGDHIIVPVSVTVRNRGTGKAGAFDVAFFRQFAGKSEAEEPQGADPLVRITVLAGGLSVTLTRDLHVANVLRAGQVVKLRAVADAGYQVAESDEKNNSSAQMSVGLPASVTTFKAPQAALKPMARLKAATPIRTFTPQERIPDLAVSAGEIEVNWIPLYDRETHYLGQSPSVLVMIRNAGNGPARRVGVQADLLDATGNSLGQTGMSISAGDILPGRFWLCELGGFWKDGQYIYLRSGTNVVIRVMVDPPNAIEERDETNNTADKVSQVIRY